MDLPLRASSLRFCLDPRRRSSLPVRSQTDLGHLMYSEAREARRGSGQLLTIPLLGGSRRKRRREIWTWRRSRLSFSRTQTVGAERTVDAVFASAGFAPVSPAGVQGHTRTAPGYSKLDAKKYVVK